MGAESIIARFALEPHFEGGHFRETHRSSVRTVDGRDASTTIMFLLRRGERSRMHRIAGDEVWHLYEGGVTLLVVDGARVERVRLGCGEGEVCQYVVRGGAWFGAVAAGEYGFVGCTVSPGFDVRDFEYMPREACAGLSGDDLADVEALL